MAGLERISWPLHGEPMGKTHFLNVLDAAGISKTQGYDLLTTGRSRLLAELPISLQFQRGAKHSAIAFAHASEAGKLDAKGSKFHWTSLPKRACMLVTA